MSVGAPLVTRRIHDVFTLPEHAEIASPVVQRVPGDVIHDPSRGRITDLSGLDLRAHEVPVDQKISALKMGLDVDVISVRGPAPCAHREDVLEVFEVQERVSRYLAVTVKEGDLCVGGVEGVFVRHEWSLGACVVSDIHRRDNKIIGDLA